MTPEERQDLDLKFHELENLVDKLAMKYHGHARAKRLADRVRECCVGLLNAARADENP